MLRVNSILVAGLLAGTLCSVDRVGAQEPSGAAETTGALSVVESSRARVSKTELAIRFQEMKTRYADIKMATSKYVPLKSDAPAELKAARLKIDAAMRSYDYYEWLTQKQRDQLNVLTDLTDIEAMRLQVAMDRLAKMRSMISKLMSSMNATGDAMAPKHADVTR